MKKILLALVLLVGCVASISTVDEVYDKILELDVKYATDYKQEMLNKVALRKDDLNAYVDELKTLKKQVIAEDEKTKKQITWLIEARKQMLLSQIQFQKAWFDVGLPGRVTDAFKCSEIDQIRNATLLFESSWTLGYNVTNLLDSLLTENDVMKGKIGVGNEKPMFYNSDFNGLYEEIESNVNAMRIYCNKTVETKKLNFGGRNEDS